MTKFEYVENLLLNNGTILEVQVTTVRTVPQTHDIFWCGSLLWSFISAHLETSIQILLRYINFIHLIFEFPTMEMMHLLWQMSLSYMIDDRQMNRITYFSVYTMSKVYEGPLVKTARQNKHLLNSRLVHCVNLSNCLPFTSKGKHLWIDWNFIFSVVFLRIEPPALNSPKTFISIMKKHLQPPYFCIDFCMLLSRNWQWLLPWCLNFFSFCDWEWKLDRV